MTSAINPAYPRAGIASTARVRDNFSAAKQEIEAIQESLLAVGYIIMYPAAAPSGWAICDGAAVSRTTYASLFTLIGTAFGAGDGSTTFNLPDMRNLIPAGANTEPLAGTGGAETVTLATANLPIHVHLTSTSGGHNHGGSSDSTLNHTHSVSAAAGGAHSHTGTTNTVSGHTHTVSTDSTGAHTHTTSLRYSAGGAGSKEIYQRSSTPANQGPTTDAGGSHSHTVTPNTTGAHTHSGSTVSNGSHSHTGTLGTAGAHTHTVTASGAHTHTVSSAGGGGAHNNMPPWLALNFIIRL